MMLLIPYPSPDELALTQRIIADLEGLRVVRVVDLFDGIVFCGAPEVVGRVLGDHMKGVGNWGDGTLDRNWK